MTDPKKSSQQRANEAAEELRGSRGDLARIVKGLPDAAKILGEADRLSQDARAGADKRSKG